jgi:hypothetical protein
MMRFLSPFIVVLMLPIVCHAWGGEAHQIIALIAEEHLTPATKAAVKELLDGASIADAEIVSWADEVKRTERRDTADWHYVNIPVDDPKGFNRARDGRDGENVIDAIDRQVKVLADRSAPREKRVEALKFVVHLVGDVHQPLHCADRNDRGGNKRLVFYPGRREAVSLHFVWDTLIVRDFVGKQKIADVAAAIGKLNFINEREWPKGTPQDWANESRGFAYSAAYRGVDADGPPPRLSSNYVNQAISDLRPQFKRAGLRLATVLNAALR